jgi:hypothetical protein
MTAEIWLQKFSIQKEMARLRCEGETDDGACGHNADERFPEVGCGYA